MKITVISNGMGTQSKLIPLLLYEKHPKLKEFWNVDKIVNIFADTGDEENRFYELTMPEYIKYLVEHNYPSLIIKNRKETHNIKEDSMTDYYINQKAMPTRQFRHCTDKFKIQVIRRYLKETYGRKHEYKILIGFTTDEIQRVRNSDVKWISNEFPFISHLRWDKKRCIYELQKRKLIHNYKTGCYNCIFLSKKRLYMNVKSDPIKKEKVILMEQQARAKNPAMTFFGSPIEQIIKNMDAQKKLGDWLEIDIRDELDSCESGYCFI